MKTNYRILWALALLIIASACGKDKQEPKASDREVLITQLTKVQWGNAVVTHQTDGDLTDIYNGFVILFTNNPINQSNGQFVVSNGQYAFQDTHGSWSLNESLTEIQLSTGIALAFTITETNLELDFTAPEVTDRTMGLGGQFNFKLSAL